MASLEIPQCPDGVSPALNTRINELIRLRSELLDCATLGFLSQLTRTNRMAPTQYTEIIVFLARLLLLFLKFVE